MGKFEASAKISLTSMANLASKSNCKIFVYADNSGKEWLLENISDSKILIFLEVDLNKIPLGIKPRFQSKQTFEYAKFGSDEMKSLTPLKWQALLDVFDFDSKLQVVVFSDLDVIWVQHPNFEINQLLKSNLLALLQDDTPRGSKGYFCTGIQIWKNFDQSKEYINDLSKFHRKLHENNFRYRDMLVGDEKAFNLFMAKRNTLSLFAPLNSSKYVIGHKVKFALIRLIKRTKPIAVHANYSSTEYLKFNKLNSFNQVFSKWKSRLIILLRSGN